MTDEGAAARRHPARLPALLQSEFVRFGLVGLFNTAFGLGLFWTLQATVGRVVHYVVIAVIANVAATFVAYVLQRMLVFRARGRFWRDLVRFSGVYVVAMLFNAAALPLLVEFAHLSPNIAQVFIVAGVAVGTYAVHRSFTFRHSRPEPGLGSGAAGPDRGVDDEPSEAAQGAGSAEGPMLL